jgi:hypothetical protein
MKKLTDKQLLQLTKTELLDEYRKLEKSKTDNEVTLDKALEVVKNNGYVVKSKTSYEF